MKNSVEIKDKQYQLITRCKEIVESCKKEVREMTDEEKEEFDKNKEEIKSLKSELKALEDKLRAYEEELPNEEEEDKEEKNTKRSKKMKKTTLVKEIRNALDNNIKSIKFNAETRAITAVNDYTPEGGSQVDGVHDAVVETEIQGILEPLYANSLLTNLGVRWYTGLPMGDISIPKMGKGSVTWKGEVAPADETNYAFTSITMQPKRLTVVVPISKQLIAQDTIGVEAAIRRDIVKAINDKLEATIFGTAAGDTTKPAGIFYGASVSTVDSYADLCDLEAGVEEDNIYGEMKYALSPKAKGFYRSLIKGNNATGMVYEAGEMDGTPAVVSSNIPQNDFVYGNWGNLAIASWGDMEITLDPYTLAGDGQIRLVVNAYFDAKVLRTEAFAFGATGAQGAQGSQGAQGAQA